MDLRPLTGHRDTFVHRMVESQEKIATMNVVDTLEEQALLEELIEETKPPIHSTRHYLIQSPFRYPPLQYGSRFGRRFEPSLFYGGQELKSALCESAFYSFYFLHRSVTPFKGTIFSYKTSFVVKLSANRFVDLTQVSNSTTMAKLRHKSDYHYAQSVGTKMRKENVDAFAYKSARHSDLVNIGIFDINAIKGAPSKLLQWEVKQTPQTMLYYHSAQPKLSTSFELSSFLVDGILPHPSA